uniref:Uncharacterized protein n=1 Tax=Setaria viridis TaxID=4556 RepID=A0A4U6VLF5_SETVI|nr:hypothetical protein SEVIR_3G395500v2 [Setaria viridis]
MYLFTQCRVTRRLWDMVANWISCMAIQPMLWEHEESLDHWWSARATTQCCSRKGMRSLIMLVSWTVWRERNSRIFERKESTINMMFDRIRDESALWIATGAKHLSILLTRC